MSNNKQKYKGKKQKGFNNYSHHDDKDGYKKGNNKGKRKQRHNQRYQRYIEKDNTLYADRIQQNQYKEYDNYENNQRQYNNNSWKHDRFSQD